jgi:hypothetical protein
LPPRRTASRCSIPWVSRRTAFIRTTSIIVDDVWCLSGATHFRRRGMTFDGSVAIASFDRQMDTGYSRGVRATGAR